MKNPLKIFILLSLVLFTLLIAITFYLIGSNKENAAVEKAVSSENIDLESALKNYPRGSMDIPAQWFVMEGMLGWEKMMFIFGYADNKEVCFHLVDVAKVESPSRDFKCEDAN